MIFNKKVQFLNYEVNSSNLHCYDFLDLESNLPFTIYSSVPVPIYSDLKQFQVKELPFSLVRVNGKTGLAWKIKAGVTNE